MILNTMVSLAESPMLILVLTMGSVEGYLNLIRSDPPDKTLMYMDASMRVI